MTGWSEFDDRRPLEDYEYPDEETADSSDSYDTRDGLDDDCYISCAHCGEVVYDDSPDCPYCGQDTTGAGGRWADRGIWWKVLGLLGTVAVLWALLLG
jgi:hypothetical protein